MNREHPDCEDMRRLYYRFKNDAESRRSVIDRQATTIGVLERQIRETERELRQLRAIDAGGGVAGAVLPGPLGKTVGVATTTATAVRIANLQSQQSALERNLNAARVIFAQLEQAQRNDELSIAPLEANMRALGCSLR